MIDFDYLDKGIRGLANAQAAGTMAGHLGAAVIAGYLYGEDQSTLPDEVYRGIEGELDRVIAGEESFWFNAQKVGLTATELFNPLPAEEPTPEAIPSLAVALQANVGTTRQSGHNVIFTALAIRALQDHPEYATPAVIAGIRKLIQGFNNASPGRGYYGKETGWRTGTEVKLSADTEFPAYESIADMVTTTIDELMATAAVRKQGFGGLWHLINHAAAITELARYGHLAVAQQALPAHHQHLRLWRSLPDVESELGPVIKSTHDPRTAIYWQGMLKRDEARLTHRIKTLYGFYTLRRFVPDDARWNAAEGEFLCLMD